MENRDKTDDARLHAVHAARMTQRSEGPVRASLAKLRAAFPPMRPIPRGVGLVAALLFLVHALLIVADGKAMGVTTDEGTYFNSGRVILLRGFVHTATVLQGPVPFYANQLFVRDFPPAGFDPRKSPHEVLEQGRLGTLPFALLSAALVFLWARMLFGEAGGLFALLLHALNPLLLGFGSLILVDAQHAAMTLLTLFLLWCWLETRSWLLVPCIGIALGFSLATKYLAIFQIAVVGASVIAASLWWARGGWRRARAALLNSAGVALCTLVTMHGLYQFQEGLGSYELGERPSHAMRAAVETPVVGPLVKLFPAPFLRGLDFQMRQGERSWKTFVNGVTAPSHKDFYLWSMLCKTPEIVLVCAALVLALRLPRLFRKDCEPGWRSAAAVTFSFALLCFGYLSLFTRMQLGIRYVLPLYPLLFLWTGALLAGVRWTGAGFVALCAATAGAHALDLGQNWPDWIAYYNVSSGGQKYAFRRFLNTNSDFGQYHLTGATLLRERYPEVQIIGRDSGARFGRLAVDIKSLPSVARWLTFHPIVDHLGASWWVFDVTPQVFEQELADRGDPDLRCDFCVAYLGAGRREEALAHLAQLDPKRAAPLHRLVAALDAVEQQAMKARLLVLIDAWMDLGRFDLAEAVLAAQPDKVGKGRGAVLTRVRACEERHDFEQIVAAFRDFAFKSKDNFQVKIVNELWRLGLHVEARETFQAWRDSLGDSKLAHAPAVQRLAERIQGQEVFLESLR